MKSFIIFAVLLPLGLAQDQPRYSCPEEFVTFRGDTISQISGVMSWEDCGALKKSCMKYLHLFCEILSLRNNMQLVIRLPILELGSNWSGNFDLQS